MKMQGKIDDNFIDFLISIFSEAPWIKTAQP